VLNLAFQNAAAENATGPDICGS